GLVGAAGTGGLEDGAVFQVEEVVHLAVGVGVGPAHEAVADHADVQRFRHGMHPLSFPHGCFPAGRGPGWDSKWRYTSWATRAHSRLPALSACQRVSSLSAVSTHSATGPPLRYRMPASVRIFPTAPVLCATATFAGRKRVNLSLSSHFLRCSIISLHASGLTSFPWCSFSRRPTISFAVVEPRPNFFVRSGATDVLLPRNTLALILVLGKPHASMRLFVESMPIWSRTRLVAVLSEK